MTDEPISPAIQKVLDLDDDTISQMTEEELDQALATLGINTQPILECVVRLIDEARNRGRIEESLPRISRRASRDAFFGKSRDGN